MSLVGSTGTKKHVGLGCTLHQATRSKQLVHLFHTAGHTISYENVLQVDTELAEKTLESMNPETGAAIPPNLQDGKFIHFTCDNIDINENSLDGKKQLPCNSGSVQKYKVVIMKPLLMSEFFICIIAYMHLVHLHPLTRLV